MLEAVQRPEAQEDLIAIWLYGADRWGAERADAYIDEIEEAMSLLGRYPEIGTSYDAARSGYRRFSVGSHSLFYRVTGGTIDVVRVLHQRMDPLRHLPQE